MTTRAVLQITLCYTTSEISVETRRISDLMLNNSPKENVQVHDMCSLIFIVDHGDNVVWLRGLLLSRVSFVKYTPLRVKIPPKASDLAHTIETFLAKLIPESGSLATSISPWILLPTWIGLPLFVQRPNLPVGVDAPSQPRVFECAWKPQAIAIKLLEPRAGLLLCLVIAPHAQLPTITHRATETRVLRIEVAAPGLRAVFWIFTGA
jgi:hypothetical protein